MQAVAAKNSAATVTKTMSYMGNLSGWAQKRSGLISA
jgi:hypothetical protein